MKNLLFLGCLMPEAITKTKTRWNIVIVKCKNTREKNRLTCEWEDCLYEAITSASNRQTLKEFLIECKVNLLYNNPNYII